MNEEEAIGIVRRIQRGIDDTLITVSGAMEHDTFAIGIHKNDGRMTLLAYLRIYDDHTTEELEEQVKSAC